MCNWLIFASIECVCFNWFSIECSIDWVSDEKVSLAKVRRNDFRRGADRALWPRIDQLYGLGSIGGLLTMPYSYISEDHGCCGEI